SGNWGANRQIVLPEGQHDYTFEVTAGTTDGRPNFRIDTVSCTLNSATDAATPLWGFDNGFVPNEFVGFDDDPPARAWQITNENAQGGGFSVRAPILPAGTTYQLSTDCGGDDHTLFSFFYIGVAAFYVDGELYEQLPNSGNWGANRRIVLPEGQHEYAFAVTAGTSDGRPHFRIHT